MGMMELKDITEEQLDEYFALRWPKDLTKAQLRERLEMLITLAAEDFPEDEPVISWYWIFLAEAKRRREWYEELPEIKRKCIIAKRWRERGERMAERNFKQPKS